VDATKETSSGTDQRVLAARSTGRALGVAKVKVTESPEPGSFGAYLIAAMDAQGLDGATLSRLTGPERPVDSSTISNLRNGNVQPGIKVLTRLAPHLGKTLAELLLAAGYGEPSDYIIQTAELPAQLERVQAILRDKHISNRRKGFLLQYITEVVDKFEVITEMLDQEADERRKK
jgi:transcriptional regulator with XRE-family HTH domain